MLATDSKDDTTKKELKEDYRSKDVAFYSALAQGWITTQLEKDKSILTLSIAGIGFQVGVMSARATGIFQVWVLGIGVLGFLISAMLVLLIFHKNSVKIESVINSRSNENNKSKSISLRKFDIAVAVSFIA